MTTGKIIIKNLSKKATRVKIELLFATYGKIISIIVNEATNDCELTYETREGAEGAFANMNDMYFMDNKVSIVLVDDDGTTRTQEISNENIKLHEKYCPVQKQVDLSSNDDLKLQEKKELLGEIIYPLAKRTYSDYAPKLTGMIIEAMLKIHNEEAIKEIISSKSQIDELIDASYNKLRQVKAN